MSATIVYIDHSEVREGQLEALRLAIDELVAFVRANEPRLIADNFYLSEVRMLPRHAGFAQFGAGSG